MNEMHDELNDQYNQMPMQQEPMQFSDEEIQNLKEIFDLFDKNNQGSIIAADLDAIMQSLQRDPLEAKDLLVNIRANQMQNEGEGEQAQSPENDRVTFEEFIKLM